MTTLLPASRTCTQCGRTLRLVDFRRYWGAKRILFDTCNACQPEKSDTPVPAAAAPPLRLKGNQTKRTRTQIENAERRRTHNWRRLIIEPLMAERDAASQAARYAAQQHTRYASEAAAVLAPGTLPALLAPLYANWQAFFEAYATALNDMVYRAKVRLHSRHTASLGLKHPVTPSLDDQNLLGYLRTPETLHSLHHLYARCIQPPRGKHYKAPWFLTWEQEDDDRREAAAQAALERVAQRQYERSLEDKATAGEDA